MTAIVTMQQDPGIEQFRHSETVHLITLGDTLAAGPPIDRPLILMMDKGIRRDHPALKQTKIRVAGMLCQQSLTKLKQRFSLLFRDLTLRENQDVNIAPPKPEIIKRNRAEQIDGRFAAGKDRHNLVSHGLDGFVQGHG
jgi:hypothetical protein